MVDTLDDTDHTVFVEGSGITIRLPSASIYDGREYYIKNTSPAAGDSVVVDVVSGGGNIEGVLSITLFDRDGIIIQSNGSEWFIIADY